VRSGRPQDVEKQRGAVVLFHVAGNPVKEIAAILGSNPAAVKVHLRTGGPDSRNSWRLTMIDVEERFRVLNEIEPTDQSERIS
jgi:hypothetical protein